MPLWRACVSSSEHGRILKVGELGGRCWHSTCASPRALPTTLVLSSKYLLAFTGSDN
jgi:hypothetical protein